MIDIQDYEGIYKFDLEILQVYSIKNNIYLKNVLTDKGYYVVCLYKNKKGKNIFIHRICYKCNNPTEDLTGIELDHIDGNPLNNKIENLRKATRSQNCSNTKIQKNNKLGIKNIVESRQGYRFELTQNGIRYNKRFDNLQDAIEYRDKFVLEKCGEFTNLG